MSNPILSVWMITYNHQDYIAQAIDSILIQKTNFDIEIVIGDDYSTDDTRKIIKQYAAKYQEIIKPIFHKKNIGIQRNFATTIENCSGKYIALCEGDDYWTDPLKLQKQVDFLEAHTEFAMSCHASSEVDRNCVEYKVARKDDDVIDLAMVLKEGWFIRTASMLFKKNIIDKGFPDFFYTAYSTDYILQVMILKTGKCKYLPEVMSAYRNHPGGISNVNNILQLKRWAQKIELLNVLNEFTEKKYTKEIRSQQKNIKRTISFYLFRYPRLIKDLGFKFYLQKSSVLLFLNEVSNRLIKRI